MEIEAGCNKRQRRIRITITAAILCLTPALTGCVKALLPNQAQEKPVPVVTQKPKAEVSKVEVPDVIGIKENQARDVIEAMKLEIDVRTSHSAVVPAGQVITQSPKKEILVRQGTTVTVRVSTGPEPGTTPAPSSRRIETVYVPSAPRERSAAPVYAAGMLSNSDLEGKSRWELDVLRNTPYARNGYRFKRSDLRNHFEQFSWYQPDTSSMSVVDRRMSSTERYNTRLVQRYQQRNGMIR